MIPFGKAKVVREGIGRDGRDVRRHGAARADRRESDVGERGMDVEVIDLRTLSPVGSRDRVREREEDEG
jgi:pyruvate/2-oxoglutarate/acetoin dehydrogenase E1 component